MKTLLALCVLMIGLMVALPYSSTGCKAPPGQSCFVAEQPAIAPAIAFAFVQENPFVVVYNILAPVSVLEMEKGGESIEYSLITTPMIYYNEPNDLTCTDPFNMLTSLDFRICYTTDVAYTNQNYKLNTTNLGKAYFPIKIRADSHLG